MGDGSKEKREQLKRRLGLPSALSTKAMLEAINILYSYDEFKGILDGEK